MFHSDNSLSTKQKNSLYLITLRPIIGPYGEHIFAAGEVVQVIHDTGDHWQARLAGTRHSLREVAKRDCRRLSEAEKERGYNEHRTIYQKM